MSAMDMPGGVGFRNVFLRLWTTKPGRALTADSSLTASRRRRLSPDCQRRALFSAWENRLQLETSISRRSASSLQVVGTTPSAYEAGPALFLGN